MQQRVCERYYVLLVALVRAAVRGHFIHEFDVTGFDLLVSEEDVMVSFAGETHEGLVGLVGGEGGGVFGVWRVRRVGGHI